jgi:excisionase family DNA binding protein
MNANNGAVTPYLHTVPESAEKLCIGRTKLYELIDAGKIKTVKIGSRTLISDDELQRFVRELGGAR